METTLSRTTFSFLQGGGEMGELTRNFDWAQTSLGAPDQWPQSLRTTVSILLNSKFPMFLFWGSELVCFYNDAYRPSFGVSGKHPTALGQKGEECWPETWTIIKPLIDQVLAGGEATWSEDQLVPIFRNGKVEDVYWTFSHSPVKDESGYVGGVLVVCNETTNNVNTVNKLQRSDQRFQNLVREASVGIILLNGEEMRIDLVNEMYGQLIDRTPDQLLGNRLFDIIPEAADPFRALLDNVRLTGETLTLYDHPYFVYVDGARKEGFLNILYQPYKELDGSITGVLALCNDVTEQVKARKKIEDSAQQVRSFIEAAPFPIGVYTGREMRIQLANQTMLDTWGKGNDVIGKLYSEILPELNNQEIFTQLDDVFKTGIPFHAKYQRVDLVIDGKLTPYYFNYSFTPVYDNEGKIYGVMNTAAEITDLVMANKKVEASEQRVRSLVAQAPIPMCLYSGRELKIEIVNEALLATWDRDQSVVGKTLKEAIPELEGQPFLQLLDDVYTTGIPYSIKHAEASVMREGTLVAFYYDLWYNPMYNANGEIDGILATGIDVTENVLALTKLEESEKNLRNIILQAPVAMCILRGPQHVVEIANERMFELWGKAERELSGKPIFEGLPEVKNQGFEDLLRNVYTTGETFTAYGVPTSLPRGEQVKTVYLNFVYEAYREANDVITGVMAVATEVTEQVLAAKKIESSEARFRLMADSMPQFIWTADAEGNLNYYNQAVYNYSGLSQDELNKDGWLKIVHPEDREENVKQWIGAITTGEDFIFHHRFKNKDDEYRWQLSRAVPQRDGSGNIQLWIGTSTDIHEHKLFEEELNKQVLQRTTELEEANETLLKTNQELKRSNANLEEFAHAASHDLKEPIRKIHFFTDRLKNQLSDRLLEEETHTFDRVENATKRMSLLIDDLLLYSHVSDRPHRMEEIDLNEKLSKVLVDLELDVQEKNATISVGHLPVVKGYRRQLQQLFQNLLSNALKYSKPGIAPAISIASSIAEGKDIDDSISEEAAKKQYHLIEIKDNGIGFDQQYADRIFKMFHRLHSTAEYQGTGVGLSIVRKVVENHQGKIVAEGTLNVGAVFKVYLPVSQSL